MPPSLPAPPNMSSPLVLLYWVTTLCPRPVCGPVSCLGGRGTACWPCTPVLGVREEAHCEVWVLLKQTPVTGRTPEDAKPHDGALFYHIGEAERGRGAPRPYSPTQGVDPGALAQHSPELLSQRPRNSAWSPLQGTGPSAFVPSLQGCAAKCFTSGSRGNSVNTPTMAHLKVPVWFPPAPRIPDA